jgi:processing peptidase subunit beta
MLMGLISITKICEYIGRQLLTYGQRLTPTKIFHRIEELTTDNVREVAHGIFHRRDNARAAVGGIEGLLSYEWIRNNPY